MKPTVGRVVHYMNLGDAEGKYPPETQAAIITGVCDRRLDPRSEFDGDETNYVVDLHIFYRTGQFDMHDVRFSPVPKRGHWSWPPRES